MSIVLLLCSQHSCLMFSSLINMIMQILDSSFLWLWSLLYFDKIMLLYIIYYASVCKFMLSEKLRWIKCLLNQTRGYMLPAQKICKFLYSLYFTIPFNSVNTVGWLCIILRWQKCVDLISKILVATIMLNSIAYCEVYAVIDKYY